MNYTHIVFDIDGTILDTQHAVLQALQDTLLALTGNTYSLEELTVVFGIPGGDSLKAFPVTDIPHTLALWNENICKYHATVSLFEHMGQVLETLKDKGFTLGLVTSKTKAEFIQDFSPFALNGLFDQVVCADDTTDHKPHPAPLLYYMQCTNTTPRQLLYIGDTIYDQRCASGAGVDFALAGWGAVDQTVPATYPLARPLDILEKVLGDSAL